MAYVHNTLNITLKIVHGTTGNITPPINVVELLRVVDHTLVLIIELQKKSLQSKMSRRKYLTNEELLDIIDNWDEDEPLIIDTVTCLPPDNVAGESDDELIDDDELSTNIACDLSPLNEVAGQYFV